MCWALPLRRKCLQNGANPASLVGCSWQSEVKPQGEADVGRVIQEHSEGRLTAGCACMSPRHSWASENVHCVGVPGPNPWRSPALGPISTGCWPPWSALKSPLPPSAAAPGASAGSWIASPAAGAASSFCSPQPHGGGGGENVSAHARASHPPHLSAAMGVNFSVVCFFHGNQNVELWVSRENQ